MPKCILCGSDYDVSRYLGFCSVCVDRAVWAIDHANIRIKIPEALEGQVDWGMPERLELADRAMALAVQRLTDLYEEGRKNLLVPVLPSDSPVWLILLAVATSAEVMKLRTRVGDLEAEVERHRASLVDGAEGLAKLFDGCFPEKKQ